MRLYTTQHQFYCGVDLHARSMYVHILDADGKTVFDQDLPTSPAAFLEALTPYRQQVVVGAECMAFAAPEVRLECSQGCGSEATEPLVRMPFVRVPE
jgi:hypothetical protein